ncbi:MAG TPA: triose-phosphate isomerase family protein [Actinomycetota bacterium]|nr:triose-phosphate isomerase family protein [Actinomycetota bacterium]
MKYLLANWKMYTTTTEAVALFADIQHGLRQRAEAGRQLPVPIICPPFLSLALIRAILDHGLVRLGAQNCHWEPEGPYTGEISAPMLKELVDYVCVGHSERRRNGETDEHVAAKVSAAARAGLVPILFVGEDERTDSAASQSERRLIAGLSRIDASKHRVLVVYEPTWAVGAERPADVAYVREVVTYLKARMADVGIPDPVVIYGGTVTAGNVKQFADLEVLDGVGATRASLLCEHFLAMVDELSAAGN